MGETSRVSLTERLLARTARALRLCHGERVIVAVSGGSDSVALLHLVHRLKGQLGLEVEVAHFDHGVRGEESRADALFVELLCQKLGLLFWLEHWQASPANASGFEARARQFRYRWLQELAEHRSAKVVLVAHTQDDQAETILHRLLRGTGPRGLCGIPRTRLLSPTVTLRRPLISIRRVALRQFLREIGQDWKEDASNLDVSRTRARIRHVLLPELKRSFNPNVTQALARVASLMESELFAVRAHASVLLSRCLREPPLPHQVILDRKRLLRCSLSARILTLRAAWTNQGWPEQAMSATHWYRLARFIKRGAQFLELPGGIQAGKQGDQLKLTFRPRCNLSEERIEPILLPVPGRVIYDGGVLEAEFDPVHFQEWEEIIDADSVVLTTLPGLGVLGVLVRPPQIADRFKPLGLGGNSMALADFLRGRRIPRSERKKVPVVCDAHEIIWVAGLRIGEQVGWTPNSNRRLGLRWVRSVVEPNE